MQCILTTALETDGRGRREDPAVPSLHARRAIPQGSILQCTPWELLEGVFTLVALHPGHFVEPEPRHGGFSTFDQGRTAIVEGDHGLTIMLTSRRMAPFCLRQLTSHGIDPGKFHLIVAKGVHAPVAAYAPACRNFLRVDTPGVTTADMTRLEYAHRRRPMFPFERAQARWDSLEAAAGESR